MTILIAVTGPVGCGKSTAIQFILKNMESEPTVIREDSYCRNSAAYVSPESVDQQQLCQHLLQLKAGKAIADIVLVEGLFLMNNPELRPLFDFILFIDVPKDICLQRRALRDKTLTNKPIELSLQEAALTRIIYHTYLKPFKSKANLVVDNSSNERDALFKIMQQLVKNNTFNKPSPQSPLGLLAASQQRGTLFIISGPSGVGKSTLIKALIREINIKRVITYTTRPKRVGEVSATMFGAQDPDYHFIDKTTFDQFLATEQFMLCKQIHNFMYGATYESFLKPLEQGQDLIVDLDLDHQSVLKKHIPNVITIFVSPAEEGQLESQLIARQETNLTTRLASGQALLNSPTIKIHYDYLIVNQSGHLKKALAELKMIVLANRLKFKESSSAVEKVSALQNL